MAGIYFHIPFCKKACHYCDFHFSTSLKYKTQVLQAMEKELFLQKDFFDGDTRIESIYFGGGTPSVLAPEEIERFIMLTERYFSVSPDCEITLEANPDDLSPLKILHFSHTKVNRLSIGVQSFFDGDLHYMNRSHNAEQAIESVEKSAQFFSNISIDLIYGHMPVSRWEQNLQIAFDLPIQHISSYALTVEPKTPLARFIKQGKTTAPSDDIALEHFKILRLTCKKNNFIPYEISNFGKQSFFSRHNTNYWHSLAYMGIGAGAHSFDGVQRSWNIANNVNYFKNIEKNILPQTVEKLTKNDRYNEYMMTGLRTIWGVDLQRVVANFGDEYLTYLKKQSEKYRLENLLTVEKNHLKHTEKGAFLIDGIIADLFRC